MTLEEAYAVCRAIAKREAKNFYYAFRVLPAHKRDAMCAVYAFMRRADDIADDESLAVKERRRVMAEWLEAWRSSRGRDASTSASLDAVFLALGDTQRRFAISDALLEDLVHGTTMDLLETQPGVCTVTTTTITGNRTKREIFQIYESFDGLYRYCYLVASVVGLVCIHIFGYNDPRAEELAEKTGIAFQLTNILRDIKEDAERARIYLPLDDLKAHGVSVEELSLAVRETQKTPSSLMSLLIEEAERAKGYYAAAEELMPMIDADSRAALWVMVTIYRGLLERIEAGNYDVFSPRIASSVFNPSPVM